VTELRDLHPSVVACLASPEALDVLPPPGHGARVCRTAPDELLLVGAAGVAAELIRETADRVGALDPDALVVDVTDGWAGFVLTGEGARRAFSYLSELELPEAGFLQGHVAHVPAKVLVEGDALVLLVPAFWEAHLRRRALADAAPAGIRRGGPS